jgi:death-on-curing protein
MFNHAFVDGNKRTTLTITARFLFVNGYVLSTTDEELIDFPLRVENKHLSIEEIADWLREHTKSSKH